jgi:hypothetical protein
MNRHFHLQLGSSAEGRSTPTVASRIKGIAVGLCAAVLVAAILFVALILGSVIAVMIGIIVIAALAFVIVRGTLLGSVRSRFDTRQRRRF